MKANLLLLSLTVFFLLSTTNTQAQQVDCNNLFLDTDTFYLAPATDTIVSGNLYYMDTLISFYPTLQLLIADTSLITSPAIMVLSSLDSGYVQEFIFGIHFKTIIFPNNTVVNAIFHIFDSDLPGDSIVSCYFPITIILENPNAINENEYSINDLKIYPNPTNNIATLEFENPKNKNYTFILSNTNGQVVRTITNITSGKTEIEKQNLASGIYFFQLLTDKQIIASGKLAIE